MLVPLSLRAEVRDFYAGQPRINVARTDTGQHKVVALGGIVLRF